MNHTVCFHSHPTRHSRTSEEENYFILYCFFVLLPLMFATQHSRVWDAPQKVSSENRDLLFSHSGAHSVLHMFSKWSNSSWYSQINIAVELPFLPSPSRLPTIVLVVPSDVLAAECRGCGVHPGGSWALQCGCGCGLFHHLPTVLVVPHHGKLTGTRKTRTWATQLLNNWFDSEAVEDTLFIWTLH